MFAWDDFLHLADSLAQRAEEECIRSAISRAYYAAFCTCSDWYKAKYQQIPNAGLGSHEDLWKAFRDMSTDRKCLYIGTYGSRLKDRRHHADYWLQYPDDLTKDAQIALKVAQQIIKTVNAIP